MKKEDLFSRTLQSIIEQAKDNGNYIEKEALEEAFSDQQLTKPQMELVYEYLKQQKIGIDEPMDPEGYLTEEDRNYLQMYLEEMEELKPAGAGETEAVTMAAMAGDTQAQKRLVELYLPKVVDVAKLYAGQGVFLEDLIGEGNLAVMLGVTGLGCLEHPSEAEGMLGKLMMDAMEDYITENATAKELDKKILEKLNGILEKAKELSESLQRKITPQELSEETGLALEEIMEAVRISAGNMEYMEGTEE